MGVIRQNGLCTTVQIGSVSSEASEGLQTTIQAMIRATGSRPVAEEAIRRLELEMSPAKLLDNLTVEQAESKKFIVLTYQGTHLQEQVPTVLYLPDSRNSLSRSAAPIP